MSKFSGLIDLKSISGSIIKGNVGSIISVPVNSDVSRASNTTFTDDPNLIIPINLNEKWMIDIDFTVVSGAGGIKIQITAPVGSTGSTHGVEGISGINNHLTTFGSVFASNASAGNTFYNIQIVVVAGSTGFITLQWAQVSSNIAATVVKAGSGLIATRIL